MHGTTSKTRPPIIAMKILELCMPSNIKDHLLGDLLEEFSERATTSKSMAQLWFWKQAVFALLHLSYRGNLASLAVVVNLLFFSMVSFVFLNLSGFEFQIQAQPLVLGLALLLPFMALPIINNSCVLRGVISYSSSRPLSLDASELNRISSFAGLVRKHCVWISVLFFLASTSQALSGADLESHSLPFNFVLGLELILLIHASALHSIFSLLEEQGRQDAQLVTH